MKTSRLFLWTGITLVIIGVFISLRWVGLFRALLSSGAPDASAISVSLGSLVLMLLGPLLFLGGVLVLILRLRKLRMQ